MMGTRNLSDLIAWRRAAVALLAFLALAFGSFAPHDFAAEQAGTLAKVEIAETAVHPGAPAHFEDAEFKLHPACPACLLQIQTGTALGRLPARLPLPAQDGEVAALVQRVPSREISLLGPARAPPTLSSPSA
jgi:hypothetical protein